ncbi:MAG: cysteine desulfurase [Clostridia bacterium]|nr:cysteine desulfurase [Clostridia bacterium]
MEHYLDNAATTAVLPCAREAAVAAMEQFGNPGSLHAKGTAARKLLDDSRRTLAAALGCKPSCVTFTSGGSESTNTALRGAAHKNRHVGKHIVSTQIEHDATLNTLKALQNQGFEVTLVAPEMDGSVSAEAICAALRPDTAVVSLMAVCNETGAVLPLREAKAAMLDICPRALLHVDAVQAFCKIDLPMGIIDMMSLSAHKLGGLKGSGALYLREGLQLQPLIYGGNQENGLRSGTEAMPQIAAFAAAAEERMAHLKENCEKMAALRDQLICEAQKLGCRINTPENCAPHIVNLSPCVGRSEVYIRVLSDQGIYVSGGSACSRGKKSHVLTAMRVSGKNAEAALRVSLCPETAEADVDAFLAALAAAKKMF